MTTIVSGGGFVPTAKAWPLPKQTQTVAASRGYMPLLRADGAATTYLGMYRSQPWVYAAVNKLTWGGGRVPLKSYTMNADGDRQRDRESELARLIKKPAPRVSPLKLRLQRWFDLMVHGKTLTIKVRRAPSLPPSELWVIPWHLVEVIQSEAGVEGYVLLVGGKRTPWRPEEAIYTELPGGVSPLEPLRRTLALEDAAMEWQGQSFLNGVTPRGAFVTEQKLNDPTSIDRLRAELTKLYAGPENAGRFGIFDQGMKWEPMGQSAVDAELLGQRRLSREEVAGVYDVSPPLIGILDRATFNNVQELHKALYVDALGPKIELFEQEDQAQLVDVEPAWDGLFVEHDMKAILRPDPEAEARAMLMDQQSSTLTVNERRQIRNLPKLDDPAADTVLIPANMTPLGIAPDPAAQAAAMGQASAAGADLAARLLADAFARGTEKPAGAPAGLTTEE